MRGRINKWLAPGPVTRAALVTLVVSGGGITHASAVTLNAEGLLTQHSCEYNLVNPVNGTLDFGEHVFADFTNNGGTAQVKVVTFEVNNCNFSNADTHPHFWLTLTGTQSGREPTVFTGKADNAFGFQVQKMANTAAGDPFPEWGKGLANFYNTDDAMKYGLQSIGVHTGNIGTRISEGTDLNFGVGYVHVPEVNMKAEKSDTSLTFQFSYY